MLPQMGWIKEAHTAIIDYVKHNRNYCIMFTHHPHESSTNYEIGIFSTKPYYTSKDITTMLYNIFKYKYMFLRTIIENEEFGIFMKFTKIVRVHRMGYFDNMDRNNLLRDNIYVGPLYFLLQGYIAMDKDVIDIYIPKLKKKIENIKTHSFKNPLKITKDPNCYITSNKIGPLICSTKINIKDTSNKLSKKYNLDEGIVENIFIPVYGTIQFTILYKNKNIQMIIFNLSNYTIFSNDSEIICLLLGLYYLMFIKKEHLVDYNYITTIMSKSQTKSTDYQDMPWFGSYVDPLIKFKRYMIEQMRKNKKHRDFYPSYNAQLYKK